MSSENLKMGAAFFSKTLLTSRETRCPQKTLRWEQHFSLKRY